MQHKNIIRPAITTLAILLIPVFGNQFINGWNWKVSDFIIMGTLIFGTGILVELANLKIKNNNYRLIVITLIIAALVAVWAHLAVGIVDTWPLAGS